jgi:hypothetical protein
MRDGIEYEFTTVFDGDLDHFVTVSKDRTGLFTDQRFQITEETGHKLSDWLSSAPELVVPVQTSTSATAEAPAGVSAGPVELSVQKQFALALADLDPGQIIAFLISRGQIRDDQSITDVSPEYAREALARIDEFRKAVVDFDFLDMTPA